MPIEKEELESMLSAFKSDITETFKTQMSDTLKEVDKKNGGTAAALTKEFQKTADSLRTQLTGEAAPAPTPEKDAPSDEPTPAPNNQDKLSLKALQNQIETLRQEREAQANQLLTEKRNNQISSILSNKKAQFADKATRAFLMENESKLKHEDGNWYSADGENVIPLDQAIDGFLNTEFGQTFQPASRGRGMNMKKAEGDQSAGKGTEVSLNDSLLMPEAE